VSDLRKDFVIAAVFVFGLCSFMSGQYAFSMVLFVSSSLMALLARRKVV
jgi:hypothetical protein